VLRLPREMANSLLLLPPFPAAERWALRRVDHFACRRIDPFRQVPGNDSPIAEPRPAHEAVIDRRRRTTQIPLPKENQNRIVRPKQTKRINEF